MTRPFLACALVLAAPLLLSACHGCNRARTHAKGGRGTGATPSTASPAAPATIAFRAPGAQPTPPPALTRRPPAPDLPDLPALDKYPQQPALPPRGEDVRGCGHVWSGAEWVPVTCIDPGVYRPPSRMAKVVVPYSALRAPTEHLPRVVDHRLEGTEGPVRQQRGPECTAFAFTAALDHALARWTGTPGNFSVMQVWARYVRFNEKAAADENVGHLVANEADWPYDAAEANAWLKCPPNADPRHPCGKPVDRAKLAALEQHPAAEITQIEALSTGDLDVLRVKLAAGQDATVAIKLSSFATAGKPGAQYVLGAPPNGPAHRPKMGHEVLLAGYAMLPHGTYYLVHNSFGTRWGDGGFAWIHEETLKAHWNDARIYVTDVEPVQVTRRRQRVRGQLTAPCPEGQLPDSISGTCAPRCPDGSPRHNDVCAVPGQCPAGLVNLTGECVLGAPRSASGTDPASRVRWACGLGGCTYWLPQGQAGCTRQECSVSCPAPDFRLASGSRGLVCIE